MASNGQRTRTTRDFVERVDHVVLVSAGARQRFLLLLDHVREGHALILAELEHRVALGIPEGCLIFVRAGTRALVLLNALDSTPLMLRLGFFALGPDPGAARRLVNLNEALVELLSRVLLAIV